MGKRASPGNGDLSRHLVVQQEVGGEGILAQRRQIVVRLGKTESGVEAFGEIARGVHVGESSVLGVHRKRGESLWFDTEIPHHVALFGLITAAQSQRHTPAYTQLRKQTGLVAVTNSVSQGSNNAVRSHGCLTGRVFEVVEAGSQRTTPLVCHKAASSIEVNGGTAPRIPPKRPRDSQGRFRIGG